MPYRGAPGRIILFIAFMMLVAALSVFVYFFPEVLTNTFALVPPEYVKYLPIVGVVFIVVAAFAFYLFNQSTTGIGGV